MHCKDVSVREVGFDLTSEKIAENMSDEDKAAAEASMPKVFAMIDKLAKIDVIHKNKAANLKSGIAVYVNKLA